MFRTNIIHNSQKGGGAKRPLTDEETNGICMTEYYSALRREEGAWVAQLEASVFSSGLDSGVPGWNPLSDTLLSREPTSPQLFWSFTLK